MDDTSTESAKWVRIFNGFASNLNRLQSSREVVQFIESAASPARFLYNSGDYEPFRESVNRPLALVGLGVLESGQIERSSRVSTLPKAERRAKELRSDLQTRGVHPEVLAFCKAELLGDDYFHAVLEATKSIAHKLRQRTGLLDDGAVLVNHVFGGENPILVINRHQSKSERDEQKGFCNLLIGTFGMFRNPTAHEARILWKMNREDAEDLLSLVSLIHRRIDKAVMLPRV
jgi:uncharacterized protein (TIGR02391 family)